METRLKKVHPEITNYLAALERWWASLTNIYGRPPFLIDHSDERWYQRMMAINREREKLYKHLEDKWEK